LKKFWGKHFFSLCHFANIQRTKHKTAVTLLTFETSITLLAFESSNVKCTFQTLSIHYTQQNNIITLPIANTCGGIVPSDFPLYFFTVWEEYSSGSSKYGFTAIKILAVYVWNKEIHAIFKLCIKMIIYQSWKLLVYKIMNWQKRSTSSIMLNLVMSNKNIYIKFSVHNTFLDHHQVSSKSKDWKAK
jgi:hypothetical protein